MPAATTGSLALREETVYMSPRYLSGLSLVVLLALVGCSESNPSTGAVSGTLQWEDGKPVSGANIRFVPAAAGGREASAYTGKDGEFILSSFRPGDGAIPGEYTVVITKMANTGDEPVATPTGTSPEDMAKAMKAAYDKAKAAGKKVTDPIPALYESEKTSPLKFRVESGSNKADLKIKKG